MAISKNKINSKINPLILFLQNERQVPPLTLQILNRPYFDYFHQWLKLHALSNYTHHLPQHVSRGVLCIDTSRLFLTDYSYFLQNLRNLPAEAKVVLALQWRPSIHQDQKITAKIDPNGKIVSLFETAQDSEVFYETGLSFIDQSLLPTLFSQKAASISLQQLREFSQQGILYGIPLGGPLIDFTIQGDIDWATQNLARWCQSTKRPCLFLDRDGVINEDKNYVFKREDLNIFPDIYNLIHHANKKNFLTICITNQSGIARRLFTEENFWSFTHELTDQLKIRNAHLDDTFFCPYHPQEGIGSYKRESYLRKPNPGLVFLAMQKYPIDLLKSIMIGDKVSDVLHSIQINTILIQGNYPLHHAPPFVKIMQTHKDLTEYIQNLL